MNDQELKKDNDLAHRYAQLLAKELGERLAQVRQKAQELGATRRQIGDVSYWDLKPDFVPGDVIAL